MHPHIIYLEDKLFHISRGANSSDEIIQQLQIVSPPLSVQASLGCNYEQGISIHNKEYHKKYICQLEMRLLHHHRMHKFHHSVLYEPQVYPFQDPCGVIQDIEVDDEVFSIVLENHVCGVVINK